MMFAAYLLFEFPHFGREKFNRGSAFGTHHVVVAAPVVLMFVARYSIVKGDFARQSTIGEKLERPVDGCKSDVRIFLLYQLVEFIGRQVRTGFEERPQNGASLPSLFQANSSQVPQKDTLGLANILRRDARLVVDSFLQHG